MDYLELELKLEHELTLFRQYMLARQDPILFTADTLCGSRPHDIEYERQLPLADGVEFLPAAETREVWLKADRQRIATLLPLSLPEWRAESHHGELRGTTLHQTWQSQGLYCPLFVDLNAKRTTKPLTWRRLTVAEKMQIVPHDTAVAYRVQLADEQWLIYKSVGPRGNRTFLGQNYSTEFLLARFSEGTVEKLIEVE